MRNKDQCFLKVDYKLSSLSRSVNLLIDVHGDVFMLGVIAYLVVVYVYIFNVASMYRSVMLYGTTYEESVTLFTGGKYDRLNGICFLSVKVNRMSLHIDVDRLDVVKVLAA